MDDENGRAATKSYEHAGSASVWSAELRLRFTSAAGSTRLGHCEHRGPLRVQRAFYPEGSAVAHVYVLHPPGGLAGGDELSIDVDVDPGAHALLTTPAAGKCYRSDGRVARQTQRLRVGPGARLEWLPQENILFEGAQVRLETRIDLDPSSVFIGWDVLCLGRPASGERFRKGRCRQSVELFSEGRPLCIDRASYEGGAPLLDARWGLHGVATTGMLFAWPASNAVLDLARNVELASSEAALVSHTLLGAPSLLLVSRYLGPDAARAREYLAQVWRAIRPELLGRVASCPRVWST
ncbi:MAG TPA: urease accessory protein UreD [Polyangiaceae bacterium]|nr:urease accessory protein UreD [Polyangiaceae bacterium]